MVVGWPPAHAESSGQFVAQRGLEHDPGSQLRPIQRLAVEGCPAPIGPAGEIRDEDVGVELRVTGAARAMPEPRRDEPGAVKSTGTPLLERCRLRSSVVRPAPHETRLALQPRQRIVDSCVDGVGDLRAYERVRERVHHRHRLRCRERQIEPWDPPLERTDLRPIRRQARPRNKPRQDGSKVVAGHRVGQIQDVGAGTEPPTRRLTGAGVVVVDTARDLGQVVGLGTYAELPQRQHDASRPSGRCGPSLRPSGRCSTCGARV